MERGGIPAGEHSTAAGSLRALEGRCSESPGWDLAELSDTSVPSLSLLQEPQGEAGRELGQPPEPTRRDAGQGAAVSSAVPGLGFPLCTAGVRHEVELPIPPVPSQDSGCAQLSLGPRPARPPNCRAQYE